MVHEIKLTMKDLEALMCGEHLGFEHANIITPPEVQDSCHVSWSLHQAIVGRVTKSRQALVDAAATLKMAFIPSGNGHVMVPASDLHALFQAAGI